MRDRQAVCIASGMRFLNSDSSLNIIWTLANFLFGSTKGFTHGLETHPPGSSLVWRKEIGVNPSLFTNTSTCTTIPLRTQTAVPKNVDGARCSSFKKLFVRSV